VSSLNFNVATTGAITVQGGQTADVLAASISTANGTGANLTAKAGDETSSTCGTACTGGNLVLKGGSATGSAGTRNGGSVSIDAGSGNTADGAINIGTNNGASINVGKTTGASSLTLQAGTGGVNLGTGGVANTIQIGNTTGAVTQTVNIGNNATASSVSNVNVGSAIGASTVTIQGGTGNVNLLSTGNVQVGVADATATLFVLDSSSSASDPTGVDGAMYYNTNSGKFRCRQGGAWADCITASGGFVSLQNAYDNSTSPEIVLDATRGALTLRDNSTPLGANLLEVQNNGGTTTYFDVTASGADLYSQLAFQSSTTGAIKFNASQTSGAGNTLSITGQNTTTGGTNGGAVNITAGSEASAGNTGGTVTIQGGGAQVLGVNGGVTIDSGAGAGSGNGTINIATLINGSNVINTGTLNIGATASGSSQTVNIKGATINVGVAGTITQTVNIGSSNSSGNAVNIESGTSGIAIGNVGSAAHTILIGANDDGTHGQTITVGNTVSSSDTTLIQGGTGSTALQLLTGASGTLSLATNNVASKTVNIGSVGTTVAGSTVSIATTTDATNAQAVTIGSAAANTGNITIIQGGSNTTQAIQLLPNTAGGIMIGATAGTGTIALGRSTATNTITIGNGAVTGTQTIQIGTAATGAGIEAVTVGGTNSSSSLTLQAGTGGIIHKVGSATSAFVVQNTAGTTNWFNIDTSAEKITIGPSAGDTTGMILVFGTKTNTGDPTGVAGGMYFNAATKSFRCYEDDHWHDCLISARSGYHHVFELGAANISGGGELVGYNLGTGSGISSSISGETGHPGIPQFNTGTTATGYDYIGSPGDNEILLGNGDYWRYETDLRIPSSPGLSTSAQRFTVRAGFIEQSTTDDGTDGCFFKYSDNVNSGKWQGTCLSSGTPTTCDTGTTVAAGTWYRLTVVVNAAGTSADFRINGTSACTVASNIPTGAGRVTGRGTSILKSVGTTDRDLDIDYEEIEGQFGSLR
jgi:hypothetical protein